MPVTDTAFAPVSANALDKVRDLRDALNGAFVERTHEVNAMLVALLAGEHCLLLGPPGTGKSAITEALSTALSGRYFQRLLTPFSVPEEVFGPFSLKGLEDDKYERQVDGYLPTADVAFLDEALDLNTPIPTPDGWTRNGDLRVGDKVLGLHGNPVTVTGLTEVSYNAICYRVTFRDGTSIVADAGHKWKARRSSSHKWRVRTTQQLVDGRTEHQVPTPDPIELPPAGLPVDPYVLGLWLGNGNSWTGEIYIRREWTKDTLNAIRQAGYCEARSAGPVNESGSMNKVSMAHTGFRTQLGDMGLLGANRSRYDGSHKRVPSSYLRGSIDQRLALIQGLMDTEGWTDGSIATFGNTNEQIVDCFAEVLRTLGIRCAKRKTNDTRPGSAPYWKVSFRADPDLMPFRCRPVDINPVDRNLYQRIVSIDPVDTVPVRCIEVDAKDHMFLAGSGMVATHNCFKANSAILNSLLTALNERAYDQGARRIPIPLQVCIGASNELPADDSLGALYDRFTLRRWVEPVRSRDARRQLLRMKGAPAISVRVSEETLRDARAAVGTVQLTEAAEDALLDLRDALARECGITMSDRRMRKAVKILAAWAALQGDTQVHPEHLEILADSLWNTPDERPAIVGQILQVANPAKAMAAKVLDAAVEAMEGVSLDSLKLTEVQGVSNLLQQLRAMEKEVRAMDNNAGVQAVADEIADMAKEVARAVATALGT